VAISDVKNHNIRDIIVFLTPFHTMKLFSRIFMGGPKNSFFHLKLIEKMSFYLNFRALKGSVPKTISVFGTALIT
jgi:hypothetical protein